jgi:hypothetical protein
MGRRHALERIDHDLSDPLRTALTALQIFIMR